VGLPESRAALKSLRVAGGRPYCPNAAPDWAGRIQINRANSTAIKDAKLKSMTH
jgi:hypothetical protein